MVTAWSPEMFITKLLEVGKFFPEYPACPAFQSQKLREYLGGYLKNM